MENNSKLSTPVAILIVGVLITAAILIVGFGDKSPQNQIIPVSDIAMTPIDASEDHILGSLDSKLHIVEYSDTECPYCKKYQLETASKIEKDYAIPGKVALAYRPFPLEQLHAKAKKEAEALECASELGGNDKFWQYLDKIFEVTPANDKLDPAELPKIAKDLGIDQKVFSECLSSGKYAEKIDGFIQSGAEAGVEGTPHTIFIAKNKINQKALDFVAEMITTKKLPAELFTLSKDKKILSFSGALPYDDFVKKLIDLIIS